ncbi:MAG TPA: class I tRNA ligase family protein [Streptomyces sp.]|uniref:class I tRNA ligase family protein n=1 Tax=Streptomyces sp. TaxID=1931 RepID=UPI002D4D5312|nr:class I tRNA ligase family protein [Streptomyces sp.]HZG03642.1 class I tRNA ligase family protein [Streptomyces sp.]
MSSPLWITATPPASHGELHIGHLAGPYVAADVLSRYLRADGRSVLFVTGTSDHNSSVELRALRDGRKPQEVAEGYRQAICADLLRAGVEFDLITEPRSSAEYRQWVQNLFSRLRADGVIAPRTRLMPYCEPCGRWLYGAHAAGECPHCGQPCTGGICYACARPNDCGELLSPRCSLCDTPAALRRCRRLYLPLEPFRDQLADHWRTSDLPPRVAALCEGLAEDGLPDIAVCHPADWGLPVPGDDFPDHRLDVCFEDVAMHLYGCWPDHRTTPEETVHFCGAGHVFCQAVLLPVLVMAQGVKLRHSFCVSESLHIEDSRTGRRSAVWALDLLTEFGSDTLRRHVLQTRPTGRAMPFSRSDLERTRQLLDATWNGWLGRLFATVREESAGLVPDAAPGGAGWTILHERMLRTAGELREAYEPQSFDPRRAVALLDEVVRSADDFGHINAYERHRPAGYGSCTPAIVAQLQVAGALAAWARPVMPEGADRLAAALGLPAGRAVTADALTAPAADTRLSPPTGPIFGF